MSAADRTRLADVDPPYRALLADLLARAGDDCRLAVRYGPDDVSLPYVRDDLLDEDLLPRADELVTRARRAEDLPGAHAEDALGDRETSIDVHEDALVVHFRGAAGEREGLIATVDRTPGMVGRLFGE